MNLVFWFALCGLQAAHWLWFRKILIFLGHDTIILAALIPAILMIVLYSGTIRKPAWLSIARRFVAIILLLICVESTIRSTIFKPLLDFEWRLDNTFWDLRKYTNLIVDHSKYDIFTDSVKFKFQKNKPPGAYRIICLGSSSTAGSNLKNPWHNSYPSNLKLILERCHPGPVEVINTGVRGSSLTQLRLYFEEILAGLDPNLLIFYFGSNGDRPSDLIYFRRIQSLLNENPNILNSKELEAALSLRWPHPALIKSYLCLTRSKAFMGIKLLTDAIRAQSRERTTPIEEGFLVESAEPLVSAALRGGADVLLIPEINSTGSHYSYYSTFEELARLYDDKRVHLLKIEDFDVSSLMDNPVHMTVKGYSELARIISDYLIDAELVRCGTSGIQK